MSNRSGIQRKNSHSNLNNGKRKKKKKSTRKNGRGFEIGSFLEVDRCELLSPNSDLTSPTTATGGRPPLSVTAEDSSNDSPSIKMSAAELALEEKFAAGDPVAAELAYDRLSREEQDGAYDSEEDEETHYNYAAFQERQREKEEFGSYDHHVRYPEFYGHDVVPDNNDSSAPAEEEEPFMLGAPVGWKPPDAPEGWDHTSRKYVKPDAGVSSFEQVDNPGRWIACHFQAT